MINTASTADIGDLLHVDSYRFRGSERQHTEDVRLDTPVQL